MRRDEHAIFAKASRALQKTFKDVGMVGHDPPTCMEGKAFLLSVLPPLEA